MDVLCPKQLNIKHNCRSGFDMTALAMSCNHLFYLHVVNLMCVMIVAKPPVFIVDGNDLIVHSALEDAALWPEHVDIRRKDLRCL